MGCISCSLVWVCENASKVAAISAFSSYLLATLVMQRYTGNGFSVLRMILLALLFADIRGTGYRRGGKWIQTPAWFPRSSALLLETSYPAACRPSYGQN